MSVTAELAPSASDAAAERLEAMHDRRRAMKEISSEIDDIAGHLNAQHGRLIDITVWLLDNEVEWSGEGVWKPEQYLMWRCGVNNSTASKIVTIARRAADLPDTIAAVRAGELSVDQALPIAKRVPTWAERRVVSLATRLTVRQIQRTVANYDFTDPGESCGSEPSGACVDSDASGERAAANTDAPTPHDVDDPDAAHTDRSADNAHDRGDGAHSTDGDTAPDDRCWWGVGDDGRFRMLVETTRDVGDVIAAALDEVRDAVFRRDGDPDGRVTVSNLDALLEVAQRSLDAVESPSRRDRHRINLHLHADGVATDACGVPLPDSIRRHLTCDGLVSPIFLEHGVPVSVGRSERIVPERTRRVVMLRDGGCRVPGCGAEHHLDIHHIVHWSDHGPTDTSNLIALCPRHHRLHHQGKLGVTGDADRPDGVTFRRADGSEIRRSGARPRPPTGPPPPITGTYEHPVGERLDPWYVDFHPPTYPHPTWKQLRTALPTSSSSNAAN